MATLNETPSAERLHIGVFGKANSGKSSFINAFTGQSVSIVAEVAGTTTDPVYKAMEIAPLGPCVLIDTAGFDDASGLGEKRVEKTRLAADKADVALILVADDNLEQELEWYRFFEERETPVLFVISKTDLADDVDAQEIDGDTGNDAENLWEYFYDLAEYIQEKTGKEPVYVSAKTGSGMDVVKAALQKLVPEEYGSRQITGDLVTEGDLVLLVMPQDIQAPKGRLILPQVQTIRELLDKKCLVMSVTTEQLPSALQNLRQPPKLIITDSQVFQKVYEQKPRESMLTSFSVLFAAYKGDLPYFVEGARQLESLTEQSKVLIAECCTHAPLTEDIGRVKIPRMLRKRVGEGLRIDMVSGADFPENLQEYDLIIQCGACMFQRKYVMARVNRAKKQNVPMTNYGVTIAYLTGILDKIEW